jgi:hypothetical protein
VQARTEPSAVAPGQLFASDTWIDHLPNATALGFD